MQILKFHGIYQQSDRDNRKAGKGYEYSSMVRVGVPGGVLTPEQYLALDRMADEAGDGGLRITTRQDIQYHRVGKTDLPRSSRPSIATCFRRWPPAATWSATWCAARRRSAAFATQLQEYTHVLARRFKPKTRAYYEIWLDGEKADRRRSSPETEPLYGDTYLPRKFKIGLDAARR